jgi:hypothetical protein
MASDALHIVRQAVSERSEFVRLGVHLDCFDFFAALDFLPMLVQTNLRLFPWKRFLIPH